MLKSYCETNSRHQVAKSKYSATTVINTCRISRRRKPTRYAIKKYRSITPFHDINIESMSKYKLYIVYLRLIVENIALMTPTT